MTRKTYFMLCWSFQLSLVCMLRNVRDDSMRGLGSEHLLRVHDSHFQLGCCSPTRACLLLCSPQALLEHISLFFTNTIRPCCRCFKNMHFTVVLSCSKQAHPWWLYTEWRVAWIMDAGSSQYRSVVICKQFSFRMCNYHVSSRSSSSRHSSPTSSSDLSADSDLCTNITGHRC